MMYKGGFGTIYSCPNDDKVVVKTQALSDDHLYREERFYMDLCEKIRGVRKYIPDLITSGITGDLRFIVIERFPFDLQQFVNNIQLSKRNKCDMAKQLISAIRFIHSFGYSHGDLKARNVLVRSEDGNVSLYLTDFGLVHKFINESGAHVPYTMGKLCLHRGTLPFISEDSHVGAIPSRRSDLENMGWLLISSLFSGTLPWMKYRKSAILAAKREAKQMISNGDDHILKKMINRQSHRRLFQYMYDVIRLGYDEEPDYELLENIFITHV